MKNGFLSLLFILFAFKGVGQTSPNLSKYFYNLPIDSCVDYIKAQLVDTNLFKALPSRVLLYKINTNALSDNHNMDSVIMKIVCDGVPIGASPGENSPFVYEQWLINTIYFKSDSAANKYFKNQKTQFDPIDENPYLNQGAKEIEWVYAFNTNDKRINHTQLHLSYEIGKRKVRTSYRIDFYQNECNCEK